MTRISEEWRSIAGYVGYEVSNLGRVRSIIRRHQSLPHVFAVCLGNHGYPVVNLYHGKKARSFTVHGLVARAFIGPCPRGQEVRHKDGKRDNPTLENLSYGTRADNEADKWRHGTQTRHRNGSRRTKGSSP